MLFNSEQQAEDKLIILYVLKKIKTSLTREQIALIIVENLQIGYFDIQLYIDDLIKDEFLSALDYDGKSVLTLSAMGKETLNVFQQKIPAYIADMIDLYLKENREKLEKLAQYLTEKETITGEEFMKILDSFKEAAV